MSGGLEIRIDENFLDLAEAFEGMKPEQYKAAIRHSINRTLLTLRKEAIDQLRRKLRIKPSVLREKYLWLEKARGGLAGGIEGSIMFSKTPIPMLEFVRGSKEPEDQKGKPVKKRRKVRAEITPGKRFHVKGAFIQRVHSTQLFKRGKQGDFHKQGVRSVGFLIEARGIGDHLVDVGAKRLAQLLEHDLRVRYEGIVKEVSAKEAGRRGGRK